MDRCVTGLIAQQQCVGPLHTPLSDYAVISLSHFGTVGAATSIGTQCLKGLIDPEIGARMTVSEALTNLVCIIVTIFILIIFNLHTNVVYYSVL